MGDNFPYQFVSDQTAKAAQIFLGALPILLMYPFLQRYFMKGLVLGSVKG
jgi:putative aldouronate transport system permease protein